MSKPWKAGLGALAAVALSLGVAPPGAAVAAPDTGAPAGAADRAAPDPLHGPAPDAPQLQNTGVWQADPTMVCDTSAYRAGEYVHQGCVYDDQGGGIAYPYPARTLAKNYTYPKNPVYRGNVADILEMRTKPVPGATAFRVTYNSMTDPDLVGTTLALGDSAKPVPAPHGANTVLPAEKFVTVHGGSGDISDAASGKTLPQQPKVTVDRERRQVQIVVPHSAFDPTGKKAVRLAAASGLWDDRSDRYLLPQAQPDKTHPGGAVAGDPTPSAFFDSAFRFDEPMRCTWRDCNQLKAIANGDISPFHATVDFTKLAAKVDDDMNDQPTGVPTHGYMNRVYPTNTELAQGRRQPSAPGGPPPLAGTQQGGITTQPQGRSARPSGQFGWVCRDRCVPDLPGRMQRYAIYVPDTPAPSRGYGSMFFLPGYALTANDQVAGDKDIFHQVAERKGHPSVVVDVDGRGSDEWFYGQSGASVLEAVADARRNYQLDNDKTAIAGFSSGAYGANKLALQFPDEFSRAFVCDGLDVAPSFPGVNGVADTLPVDTVTKHEQGSKLTPMLPNRRNQPVMEWAGTTDDFIPYNITRERANAYADSQQDYEFVSWSGVAAEHLTMCHNGMWNVMTRWLGDMQKQQNPFHVTFVRNPLMDDPASGLVGDHAYWLSDVKTRNGQLGTVDAVSHGFGLTDPAPVDNKTTAGVSEGTLSPVNPYTREHRHPGPPQSAPKANAIDLSSDNIESVTVHPQQAKVGCDARINVTGDKPVTVRMLGCGPARTVAPQ